jgi:Flp pilus assembly pilin Flp
MLRSFVWTCLSDEDGVTSAEYAVMLVLIICAVIFAVTAVGNTTADEWSNNVDKVVSACTSS